MAATKIVPLRPRIWLMGSDIQAALRKGLEHLWASGNGSNIQKANRNVWGGIDEPHNPRVLVTGRRVGRYLAEISRVRNPKRWGEGEIGSV